MSRYKFFRHEFECQLYYCFNSLSNWVSAVYLEGTSQHGIPCTNSIPVVWRWAGYSLALEGCWRDFCHLDPWPPISMLGNESMILLFWEKEWWMKPKKMALFAPFWQLWSIFSLSLKKWRREPTFHSDFNLANESPPFLPPPAAELKCKDWLFVEERK